MVFTVTVEYPWCATGWIAHLELDPWVSQIVSPATDDHETAVAVLHDQALRQLALQAGHTRSNGLACKAPGGSGYASSNGVTRGRTQPAAVPRYHRPIV